MSTPRVLLVDEPSLGLAPLVVEQLYELFAALRDEENITLVLVEQYVEIVLELADRAVVLEKGATVLSDSAASLAASPELVGLYIPTVPKDQAERVQKGDVA
jgi:branched-chain amino acid transport system ATP-binding protein